jgi:hypothetical protein
MEQATITTTRQTDGPVYNAQYLSELKAGHAVRPPATDDMDVDAINGGIITVDTDSLPIATGNIDASGMFVFDPYTTELNYYKRLSSRLLHLLRLQRISVDASELLLVQKKTSYLFRSSNRMELLQDLIPIVALCEKRMSSVKEMMVSELLRHQVANMN